MTYKAYVRVLSGLLVIISVVIAVEDDRSCPRHGVNFRGRCFWFFDVSTTWFDAGHLCNHLYGDHVTLVTIKDRETNDFIRSHAMRPYWIGLHEAHGETKWRWVDNTELANGNYMNWGINAPSTATPNSGRDCAVMHRNSDKWGDEICTENNYFVCAELPSAPMCPNGGIFFRDRCYWRGAHHLSWSKANQACQDEFGPEVRLAVARDAEVNMFLSRLAYPKVWLGLSDKEEEGVWKWVDGAPLEYSNWLTREPNNGNNGNEDCAALRCNTAEWQDLQCEYYSLSYICAIPPCYERTISGDFNTGSALDDEDVEITDRTICTRRNCTQHCVAGGACNDTGQCICVRQFPGMTCDLDEWKVEMENELINATTGGNLTLNCKVNLPVDHISSISWTKCAERAFFPEYRTTITDVLSQGYSTLHITDVALEDAGEYHCQVVLSLSSSLHDTTIPVARTALVDITEASTPIPTTKPTTEKYTTKDASTPITTTTPTTERTSTKDASTPITTTKPSTERTTTKADRPTKQSQGKAILDTKSGEGGKASKDALKYSTYKPTGGTTAVIAILLIMTTLLLVTVSVLMIKLKRLERGNMEDGRLMELEERS